MELVAQRVVDGFLSGKNRSSRHGFSVEFVEHREYVPGDDLRHLDWKVLGRMGRYYIKRYEEETNISAMILLDASASMTYARSGRSKFECAATAAIALAHLLQRQRDAVGVTVFDSEVRALHAPSARMSALAEVVARLHDVEPSGKTSLVSIVERAIAELPGRSLVILLSDFFVPMEEIEAALKLLRFRGHDAVVLQTLDDAERTFPFRENLEFRDLEGDRRLLAEPRRLRRGYLEALESFLDGVRRASSSLGYDYALLVNGEPLATALTALLAQRNRRRRAGRRGQRV